MCDDYEHCSSLQECNNFGKVIFRGKMYHFGTLQARVIKQLYLASFSSSPWLFGKTMLGKASAHSLTVRDLFKSQKNWRDIIESDGRGYYRLKL